MIKDLVNAMTVEDTKSITLIFKRRDDASAPQFYAYGVDMESIGATQVICQVLGQELLSRDFADISE